MNRKPGLGAAFWGLWTAAGLANLADGVLKVVLPLFALHYTRSPTLIAGLAFALSLPWLLCALPAGVLVDRLDRRRTMLVVNAVRFVVLAGFVVSLGVGIGSIWVLYAVALVIGVAETLYDTAAQSIVPQLVGRERLSVANGRLQAVELSANQFVGPPVAGFLVALSTVLAFGFSGLLWAGAGLALLAVRGRYRVDRPVRTTIRSDLREGLRFVWRNPMLRRFALITGLFNLLDQAAGAIFVLFAVGSGSVLRLSEREFGFLLTTVALGSLAGSFVAPWLERRFGRTRVLLFAVLAGALYAGAPALSDSPWLIGAGFFVCGVGIVVFNVVVVSLRQRITPDRLLGRVNSAYRLVAWGTMPLGAALGGLLASFLSLTTVFAVLGVAALALVGLLVGISDERLAAAEAADEPVPA